MSVLQKVKRFFANTIHGYAEVFKHRYVDYEVVSRKLMCDIRAFGKEIMDIPDDTDIHTKEEESESEVDSVRNSPKSCKTFDVPDFTSDLDLNECAYSENKSTYQSPDSTGFDVNEFASSLDVDVDTQSTLLSDNCKESPPKKGYDHDSDYEPEKKVNLKKRKFEPQVKWNGKRFKVVYTLERYIDFSQGQTRVNKKLRVNDESLSGIVQKVLTEGLPVKEGDVFYKCARNWQGVVLPGLVVTTKGHFFAVNVAGVFRKPVSMKDRCLYHDSMRIHAPRIVFSTFTKGHPGLNGEAEDDFYFMSRNRNKYNIGIDNLICVRGEKTPKGRNNL